MHDHDEQFGTRSRSPGEIRVTSRPTPLPYWPFLLLAMIPAYFIQFIPLLNIFLILLLSPLWIGLLLNGALVGMIIDVRRGAAPKALLIVPIAVYGLTLAASAISYGRYRVIDQRLERENVLQAPPFDPVRMSLVAPDDLSQVLVQRFALPVAYGDLPDETSGRPSAYRVLPKAVCDTIPRPPEVWRVTTPVKIGEAYAENVCLLTVSAKPSLPAYTVTFTDRFAPRNGYEHIELTAPDGRRGVLRRGRVPVLLPIPFPLVVCTTWTNGLECHAQMSVGLPVGASSGKLSDEGAGPVARALGLAPRATTPVGIGSRPSVVLDDGQTKSLAAGSEAAVIQAQGLARKVVDDQFAMLSRFLAGQDPGGGFEAWLVIKNADRLDAQADALAEALTSGKSYKEDLGRIAAALKPDVFARIGPRLLPAVAADPTLREADSLVVRLGDLGAPAVPTLLGLFEVERGTHRTSALLGLCRAGREARGGADQVAAAARSAPWSNTLQAGVAALLRMGRPDLARSLAELPIADSTNEAGRRHHRQWIDKTLATVGPDSPRSACTVRRGDSSFEIADVPWLKD